MAAKWLLVGLLLLLAALALTLVAAGEGTVSGDAVISRAVQRPASAEIDAVARLASLVGDDFPAMVKKSTGSPTRATRRGASTGRSPSELHAPPTES